MVRINDSLEFDRLLESLSKDVVNANIHWKLYCDLIKALQENLSVYSYSPTFWYLTLAAHRDTSLQCLCRVYDKHPIGLHLSALLGVVKSEAAIFNYDNFLERMSSSPFIENIRENYCAPDLRQLETDINLCSNQDAAVNCLIQYRSNALAHKSAKIIAAGVSLSEKFPISVEIYEKLLLRAQEILNRYSVLFKAESYSSKIVGDNDYRFIFSAVLEKIEKT